MRGAGIEVAAGTAWDDAFFAAFLARVEPAIAALDRPLILHDWPAPLAALAGARPTIRASPCASRPTSAASSSRTRSAS